MKALLSKKMIAGAAAALSLFATAGAQAATIFPDFKVDKPNSPTVFTADKITGNYTEIATFNPDGTFNVSLLWVAGQFVRNDGNTPLGSGLTGLGSNYNLYATYTASGRVVQNGPRTTFLFSQGTGSLKVYLDAQNNTITNPEDEDATPLYTAPADGRSAFTFNPALNSDDILLANGVALRGQGTLDPTLQTCGNSDPSAINCGSFGSTTTFSLTDAGKMFFIDPKPFYNLSFQAGQLNNFTPSGTQTINGSLDVVFGVPEPTSLGLLGLGLLGLSAAAKRRKKA